MILFRTLGAAELEEHLEACARPIAIQAKRLALLAYAVLAGRGRHRRRDSIVALFWPDLDEEHARSALRQALTYLRRILGSSAVVTRGEEEIAIDADALRCDAVQFDEAVAAGKLEDAMALYRGDFLEGLFVSEASPELGQWIDTERSRLRQAAATCASSLAEESWQRSDGASAARWARVAVALGPDDERKLRRLVKLLDSIGDRAGALEAHERFARRLASEYSAEPSAETKALMAEVRSRSATQRDERILTPHAPASEGTAPSPNGSLLPRHAQREPARRSVALLADACAVALAFAVLLGSTHRHAELLPDSVALHSYIEGRYWLNKRGPGLLRSIGIFTKALDRDPTFALAYAGMADAYVQLGYASLLRPDDAFPKARAAAERALQLDASLAEPHATLGFVKMYYDWDWPGAEREFQTALTLNPSYATAHEWYGLFLTAMGRFDEAREHEHRAQVLDPLSTAVAGTAAWVLYYAGNNDEAERQLRIALRADSTFALGRFYLGRVHQSRGKLDSALAAYHSTGPLRDWVPTIAAVGHVYGTQGRRAEALATLTRLDSLSHHEYVTAYAVALVHASLGQRDSAFAWLDRGVAERTHWLVWLRRDPRWAPIRSDPRFETLAMRLKLPK
jgi:DNA-binding SARP family transcriptional activator/Tfp pilus assembly protein PilF